jgi:hypothetical protein
VICAEPYLFEFERRGYLRAGAFVTEVLEHPAHPSQRDDRREPRILTIAVERQIVRWLGGRHPPLLHPFRHERFETGELHRRGAARLDTPATP